MIFSLLTVGRFTPVVAGGYVIIVVVSTRVSLEAMCTNHVLIVFIDTTWFFVYIPNTWYCLRFHHAAVAGVK